MRQDLQIAENDSRAQANLELPDSAFPVALIVCTWHKGDREGLGECFLSSQGKDLSSSPQVQGMGMVPNISHPGPPVVRWELEPGEAQEARGPVCSACNVHETESRPHSERWGYPDTPAPVFIQRIKEQRGGRGGKKSVKMLLT